jgi:hypothetical protein
MIKPAMLSLVNEGGQRLLLIAASLYLGTIT